MKKHSQIQQFVSVLIIFVLFFHLSGCYSTKIISKSDLHLQAAGNFNYIVHSSSSGFLLGKSTISNGKLSGRVIQIISDNHYNHKNKIDLYFSSDSVIKIDKGENLSVPVDEITKIVMTKENEILTSLCITGGILLLFIAGIIIYQLNNMDIDLSM